VSVRSGGGGPIARGGTVTGVDAARLQQCLAGDGVAVIPTDTVYGLACNPDSEAAVRRIHELKRRPPWRAFAVMFFSLPAALQALPDLGPRTRTALAALLPGPLTLLLPNQSGRYRAACGAGAGMDTGADGGADTGADGGADGGEGAREAPALLGLRVPALSGVLSALAAVSVPAAQSSANLSGDPEARRLEDVPIELRRAADLALDGGELPGAPSTVVDLSDYERSGRWRIVRAGPTGEEEIERVLASC
jgi:L-threonylcarbamoyladenylate synthase